jgi:dihydroorotate dehydrogenase (NAD+) catalytic subunit
MTASDAFPTAPAEQAAHDPAPALTLAAGKRDLVVHKPLMNAAGFLGCDGPGRQCLDFSSLGAYVTPPTSLQPRSAARGARLLTFPGGFLLHTGHPNPGLRAAIRRDRRHWNEMPCPVIAHLLLRDPDEASEMARWVEPLEEVSALELGLGEVDPAQAAALVKACAGEFPLIAHLPLGSAIEVFAAAVEGGAHAVSVGAPRGALPGRDGTIVHGRLYGPAIFPHALQAVTLLKEQLQVPILASGGIYRSDQVPALLRAGASAVQLDGILWTTPEGVLSGIASREG